ncbi:MFS transporter [Alicyclobacillus sp. ALC3]|uniref:MFS transporter n=1 Tax=Alicyclobacillus sp. ALC3 TaxID=2796143 RepID=UPI002379F1C0|nr:MFS transporter [Alicyclobacillus sp. ALC3]WDL98680.1 MFS transporter [Alicyclobacillus sp. ALC3]
MEFWLRNPAFVRLWAAQFVSELGDGMLQMVLVVTVALDTHSGFAIGLMIFTMLLPRALVRPFAGPLADKWPKGWLMVSADMFRLLVVLGMLPFRHHVTVLLAMVAVHEVGSAFFLPARSAAVPLVAGEEHVGRAIGISQSTSSAMSIAGPALAGALLAIGHPSAVFLADAASFLLSAGFISSLPALMRRRAGTRSTRSPGAYLTSLREGWSVSRRTPTLRFLILSLGLVSVTIGMVNTDSNALLLNSFHVPVVQFGLLDSVAGVGAILGAIAMTTLITRARPATLLVTALVATGAVIVCAPIVNVLRTPFGLLPVYAWMAMFGALGTAASIPVGTLLMQQTSQDIRGRVSSILQSFADGGNLIGILAGGAITGLTSALIACVIAGVLTLMITIVMPFLAGFKGLFNTPNAALAGLQSDATESGGDIVG